MKRVIRVVPAIAAIAVGSLLIAGQDKEIKPEMSLVVIEQVTPSMTSQYEEATKAMCALLT